MAQKDKRQVEQEEELELLPDLEEKYVQVFRFKRGAIMPKKADPGASGYDLCAVLDTPLEIVQGEVALVPTGLNVNIPYGYEIQIRPRSGLALRKGLTVLNTPGTIDSSYSGEGSAFEVQVIMINHSKVTQTIMPGERIAQAVICKLPTEVTLVETFTTEGWSSGSRIGGFGSTGTHALG